mgnify:CR=1 FL=1
MILELCFETFFPKQRLRYGVLTCLLIAGEPAPPPVHTSVNLNGICRKWDTSMPFRRDATLADGTFIEKTHMI